MSTQFPLSPGKTPKPPKIRNEKKWGKHEEKNARRNCHSPRCKSYGRTVLWLSTCEVIASILSVSMDMEIRMQDSKPPVSYTHLRAHETEADL
eukprot:3378702-Amphidinium_carterae.1